MGGQRFITDDEVKEEFSQFLKGLAAEFYNMGIEIFEHRLQKCLDRNGLKQEKPTVVNNLFHFFSHIQLISWANGLWEDIKQNKEKSQCNGQRQDLKL
ncbi:hypothetical protein J6590_003753 [Homalodisca vitripennis]|nr:hypothetical protein J6590_003753 [Homalodisca vitripennis]